MNTRYVLKHATNCLVNSVTSVYMDSGVANLNKGVDKLLEVGILERVIAQIDVSFSNSMNEAWWRLLKSGWLFINQLDNISTLRRSVEFYVSEHNQRMPHSAFNGQTPDEMYFGRGATIPDALVMKRREAQRRRVEHNQRIARSSVQGARGTPSTTSPHEG